MIVLTPYSRKNILKVSSEEYEDLVHKCDNGWSNCVTKEEYMAKLHYLRKGFKQGKISKADFLKREEKIVVGYWNKGN